MSEYNNVATTSLSANLESALGALYAQATAFPLYGIKVDGSCGCSDPDCEDIGKHPVTYGWQRLPAGSKNICTAGHGIVTGRSSGFFVIDLDVKNGKDGVATFSAMGECPDTYTVATGGGGVHLYFQLPDFSINCSVGKIGPGIDVRGDGGYVVAPTSPHASGSSYEVLSDAPITNAPSWLLAKLQCLEMARGVRKSGEPGENAPIPVHLDSELGRACVRDAVAFCQTCPPSIQGDNGSSALWAVAIKLLRRLELPYAKAKEIVLEHFNPRCLGPWEEWEIDRAFENARDKSEITSMYPEDWQAWMSGEMVKASVESRAKLAPKVALDFAAIGERATKNSTKNWNAFDRGDEVELSERLLQSQDERPVFAEGAFYRYDATRGVWDAEGVHHALHADVRSMSGAKLGDRKVLVNNSTVKGVLSLTSEACRADKFFESPAVGLACRNGFVRVADDGTISVGSHSKDHRARAFYDLDFDPDATSEPWEAFLRELFDGDDDAAGKMACLQEFFGGALLGTSTRFQRCIMAPGSGANGKSTLLEIVTALFPPGKTAASTPHDWTSGDRVARLPGVLLNATTELPSAHVLASEVFKNVIVGDRVTGERKYESAFEFKPVAGHIFACNHLPSTNDQTTGFWRRFIVIEFNRRFEGAAADTRKAARLLETERPGILAWMVRGAARLLSATSYTIPSSHAAALERWRENSDSVRLFLSECTSKVHSEGTQPARLYDRYRQWAIGSGYKPVAANTLGSRLKDMGLWKRLNTGATYLVTLLPDATAGRFDGASTARK